MSLSGMAARGALTTLGGQWAKFLVQSVGIVVLSRLLTPADFGLYAMMMGLIGVASLFGDFGLSMASIQAAEVSSGQRTNLFWANIAIGVAMGAMVFLAAGLVGDFYDRPELVPLTQTVSVVFLLQAAKAQFAANASRELRFGLLAWIEIFGQVAALVAGSVAALAGAGVWSLVMQQLVAAVVTLAAFVGASQWRPGLPVRDSSIRPFFAFGGNLLGVQIVNYLSSNLDSVLLGRAFGAAEVGAYDRAYQLFRVPSQQIAAPMTRVALPVLSKISDERQFESYLLRAQLVITYALGGAFAIAIAVADPLLPLVLGPGWERTPLLFSVLAIGGMFSSMGYINYWIFLSRNMTGLHLRYSVATRIVMVGLIVLGLRWGSLGVAAAVTVGLAVNWAVLTFHAVPRAGVSPMPLVSAALRPLALFTLMVASVRAIATAIPESLGNVLVLAMLLMCSAVFLGLSWTVVPSVRRDVGQLVHTVRTGMRGR